nr:unnamed protein product [Spirometra erinaceieuropaei]
MSFCMSASVTAQSSAKGRSWTVVASESVVEEMGIGPVDDADPGALIALVIREEGESVGTDYAGEFGYPKGQARCHEAVLDGLRQTQQLSYDVVPDGKGDACVTSPCFWAAAPEEGLGVTHLPQLAFLGEADLAERSDAHYETPQFLSEWRRPPFRPFALWIV